MRGLLSSLLQEYRELTALDLLNFALTILHETSSDPLHRRPVPPLGIPVADPRLTSGKAENYGETHSMSQGHRQAESEYQDAAQKLQRSLAKVMLAPAEVPRLSVYEAPRPQETEALRHQGFEARIQRDIEVYKTRTWRTR